jgi:hypothetical protein
VLSKKSNLHRKLVTAALDIRLVDNRHTWEDIPLFCRVQGKEPPIQSLIKIVGWARMGHDGTNKIQHKALDFVVQSVAGLS